MRRALCVTITMLAALLAPATAAARDPIMPLDEVRSGMRCTGLSVVRGTTISSFDVEVVDVITDGAAEGPRILIRVSGPAVEAGGIASGFSGSPMLCPGRDGRMRNAGGISATVGEFGNKLGLATPIELMLREPVSLPRRTRRAPAIMARARPIATPLSIGGLSPRLAGRLNRAAARAGQAVRAVPAGPLGGFPRQRLVPGAAVSAALAGGDVTIGGVGTVTYRDGARPWAFGHPFEALGPRSLLLQDAYVFTVVGSPLASGDETSYKLAVGGHTLGTFGNDTLNAIVGRVGRAPRTIPVTVRARDGDTGRRATVRSVATDEPLTIFGSVLEAVGAIGLEQAQAEALASFPGRLRSRVCLRISVRERGPLGYCNHYFGSLSPVADVSTALALVGAFKFGKLTPTGVSIRVTASRRVPERLLVRAETRRRARAGTRIGVRLTLKRAGGGRAHRRVSVRIPRGIEPGRRTLTVRSPQSDSALGDPIGTIFQDDSSITDDIGPRSLAALAGKIRGLRRREGVRAGFAGRRGPIVLRAPGVLVRGSATTSVRVLPPRR